jgi:hypothetical protein
VKIVALRTEYIVRERYINATACLNIIAYIYNKCSKCPLLVTVRHACLATSAYRQPLLTIFYHCSVDITLV